MRGGGLATLAIAMLLGCGENDAATPIDPPTQPPVTCAEGTIALPDGSCLSAGVPECAEGFALDEARGCVADLPATACAPGTMAVPGDGACREVAPCGQGTWGDILVDASTEHVDESYTGGGNDGSAQAPWTTIQQAIAAAAPGAVIAVAEGSYSEDVDIDRAVTLWGRCPSLVTIVGGGNAPAAVTLGAQGAVVRGVAITGNDVGLGARGSTELEAAELWIHDTGAQGVAVSNSAGPAGLLVRDSLIESTTIHGLVAFGDLRLERSVVRGVDLDVDGSFGRGIEAVAGADVVIVRSVIEATNEAGALASGPASITAEGVLVRDTVRAQGAPSGGYGILVQSEGGRPSLSLTGVVMERTQEAAVLVTGADAVLSRVTIRDVVPVPAIGGRGVLLQAHPFERERAVASISESLIERVSHAGILAIGSDASIDGTAVRDVDVELSDPVARGVSAEVSAATGQPSHVVVSSSTVQGVMGVGAGAIGSGLELRGSAVAVIVGGGIDFGRCVHLQLAPDEAPATGILDNVSMFDCSEFGMAVIGSQADLTRIAIRDVTGRADGLFGDGIAVEEGTARILDASISRARRSGVTAFDAHVELGNAVLECNGIDLDGEERAAGSLSFVDLGGNTCGCEDVERPCKLSSTGLAPPPSL